MNKSVFYKLSSRTRGLTLIEVAIASVISLLATTAVMSVFISSSKMAVDSFMRNRSYTEGRIVTEYLASDIRAAAGIESSYKGYTASADTLILKLPSIDSNGFPVDINTKFDRVVYHPAKNNRETVVRTVISDSSSSRKSEERAIGSSSDQKIGVKGSYQALPDALGAYVIYYKFTADQTYGSKSYETPLAGSIRLRNRA